MKKHTLNEYKTISADVWMIFRKYFPNDADTATFAEDIHQLDQKYRDNPRTYEFCQKLMRVYFQELNEIKGVKNEKSCKSNT